MIIVFLFLINFCNFELLVTQAGIGTDATMHDHIKKLLDRCYATKDANMRFSPTNLVLYIILSYFPVSIFELISVRL